MNNNGTQITYRILNAGDAAEYKKIRLIALAESSCYFEADLRKEKARSFQAWQEVCTETCDHAIAGAFFGKRLIGVISAHKHKDDATGKTAYYGSGYIYPFLRHTKTAGILFYLLDDWAHIHGYEKNIFAIRKENTKWIEKQLSHGSEIKGEILSHYANGETAKAFVFNRPLPPRYPYPFPSRNMFNSVCKKTEATAV